MRLSLLLPAGMALLLLSSGIFGCRSAVAYSAKERGVWPSKAIRQESNLTSLSFRNKADGTLLVPASGDMLARAPIAVAPLPADLASPILSTPVDTSVFGTILPTDALFATILDTIARTIEAQRLAYDSGLGQDCSGIFHRVKDSLVAHLPLLADTARYVFPDFGTARSSRQIADWYYRHGNLLLVTDPLAARPALRPGAVLFFSRPGRRYRRLDIELLTDRNGGYTRKGAISHIAIVTAVERDAAGEVAGYTMLHGRNRRVPASRSSSRAVQSRFTKGLPPFGNWSQQWVAVARVETRK